MVRHADIEDSAKLRDRTPWLVETAGAIGDRQVRNLGTIGGSLAHADPSADWTAMALAAEAHVVVTGRRGERSVAAEEFLRGAFDTCLELSEIVTSVSFPVRDRASAGAYAKFRHPASGYAVAGAAVLLSVGRDNRLCEVRVSITGVGPVAYRARQVEQELETEPLDAHIAAAASHAADGVEVLADTFADREFRAHLATIVTERAVQSALQRLR
jgi:carbon-monoxide dehydrogenase medium subunit